MMIYKINLKTLSNNISNDFTALFFLVESKIKKWDGINNQQKEFFKKEFIEKDVVIIKYKKI